MCTVRSIRPLTFGSDQISGTGPSIFGTGLDRNTRPDQTSLNCSISVGPISLDFFQWAYFSHMFSLFFNPIFQWSIFRTCSTYFSIAYIYICRFFNGLPQKEKNSISNSFPYTFFLNLVSNGHETLAIHHKTHYLEIVAPMKNSSLSPWHPIP